MKRLKCAKSVMGQHKHNPTAIAAKEGKLPPKRPKWADDELFQVLPIETKKKIAMLEGMSVALLLSGPQYNK